MSRVSRFLGLVFLLAILPVSNAGADFSDYGIASLSASQTTAEAGAHPDFTFEFHTKGDAGIPFAATREVEVDLPPGLLANPNAVPQCSALQLTTTDVEDKSNATGCPLDSQVGVTEIVVLNEGGAQLFVEPIFNMQAPGGDHVARLGFIAKGFPVFADARLRSESDYGATVTISGAGSLIPLLSASTTIWGIPAEKSHDSFRLTPHESAHCGSPCTAPGGLPRHSSLTPTPFMTNPTQCGMSRQIKLTVTSYPEPDRRITATTPLPDVTSCGKLHFKPSFSVVPSSSSAGAPTGLEIELSLPQDETPNGRATAHLKDTVFALPEGMTLAPGAADGLQGCSAAQAGFKSREVARCPEASKIGSAEIDSPALSRPLQGALYLRSPEPGDLYRIWVVADDLGVHLALPGDLEVDPVNGQLESIVLDIPQAPVRKATFVLKSGGRAALANPTTCGDYSTSWRLSPWSGTPPVEGAAPMTIAQSCGVRGFSPRLTAGTTSSTAGKFSPFVFTLTRDDDEQNVAGLDITLPPGLVPSLRGIPLCEGAAAIAGDCPIASQIGRVTTAVGPGPQPFWAPQTGKDPLVIYLGGPYKAGPLSIVVVAPAQAGPFDLGRIVVRSAIYVDSTTAIPTIKSDSLPQIIEGIPLTYRTIHVAADRSNFMRNPTSCAEMSVDATVFSAAGTAARASSRFQASDCAALPFEPRFSLRLVGSTKRLGHPSVRAKLRPRSGDANIAGAQVALPGTAILDQSNIGAVCTRVQFAAGACPPGSVYGRASVTTPVLDSPLEGVVYLRSSNNLLPDMVVALKGPPSLPINFDLVGRIDSFRGGIRTTFVTAPDVPFDEFSLTLPGGKSGLLVNTTSLCKGTPRALVNFKAHNGLRLDLRPRLESSCGKKRKKKRRR